MFPSETILLITIMVSLNSQKFLKEKGIKIGVSKKCVGFPNNNYSCYYLQIHHTIHIHQYFHLRNGKSHEWL